ncbi:hypothetical protein JFJ08_03450 [Vibrio atlanticus]|nr:hypothetical protein [Vibrio atlanticus]
METFNVAKKFEPSHLALDSEKIGLLLASHDAHLLVTSYDGASLWDDASGEYQIRLYIDLEQVAICDADEHEGIGNLQLHPVFSSHRELIAQIFSGYLDAPETLFEISEFHAVSLNALSELRSGQYSIQTVNGEQLLILDNGADIATMCFSEDSHSVSFTSELLINSPIYSHKLASEILNAFSDNSEELTDQVKKDLIGNLEKLNEDLRYNRVPRSKLLTPDPLFVTSTLTKEAIEVKQENLKVAKIVANSKTSKDLVRDAELIVTANSNSRYLSIFHHIQEIYRVYQDVDGSLLTPEIDERFKPVKALLDEVIESCFDEDPLMCDAEVRRLRLEQVIELKEGRFAFEHIDDTFSIEMADEQLAVVCESADSFQFYCSETSPLVVRAVTDIFVEKLEFFSQEYANELVESVSDNI